MDLENLSNELMINTLKSTIIKYKEIQDKEKEIAKIKAELKDSICQIFDKLNISKFEFDDITATIIPKVTFKYIDEIAIINQLKQSEETRHYVKESIDTSFNTLLKGKTMLSESLSNYYTKNISKTLKVE